MISSTNPDTPVRTSRFASRVFPQVGRNPAATTPRASASPLSDSLSISPFSPDSSLRAPSDCLVFELGARYLRAGLGGEAQPRALVDFSPDTQRIAGDFSQHLPSHALSPPCPVRASPEQWGRTHELWRMHLQGVDIGLVGDRVERAVRTALNEHVLALDGGARRSFAVVVDSLLPRPLLAAMLDVLFGVRPAPMSVVLFSAPMLCAVAAGLRSALVVDIGWAETRITAVYEYRQVLQRRSVRGMKMLGWAMHSMLAAAAAPSSANVSFEETEAVVSRFAHCRPATSGPTPPDHDQNITIPLASGTPPATLTLPFSHFTRPTTTTFLSPTSPSSDDHNASLPALIYSTLLHLSLDQRAALLPRIILTGGGASIPGLRARLLAEVAALIAARAWDPVHSYGSARAPLQHRRATASAAAAAAAAGTTTATSSPTHEPRTAEPPDCPVPAHARAPSPDPILADIHARTAAAAAPPGPRTSLSTLLARAAGAGSAVPAGAAAAADDDDGPSSPSSASAAPLAATKPQLRCVRSQGAWAGASLLAALGVQGSAEVTVTREQWMRARERDDEGEEAAVAMGEGAVEALLRELELG